MAENKKTRFNEAVGRLDSLLKDLESKEFRVKNEAIKALGSIRHNKARDKLLEIISNSAENVRLRIAAIDAVGRNGRDSAAMKLFSTMAQDLQIDKELRRAAITQLSRYKDQKNIPIFAAALKDPYRFIRFWAVRALIKMREPAATKALIYALGDEDEEIRKEVTAHLETLGETVLKDLIRAFEAPDANKFLRYGAAGLLGRIADPLVVRPLIDALKDGNDRVVTIAIRGLGKIISPDSIKPLIDLAIKSPDKRRMIFDSLFKIGQTEVKPLMEELGEVVGDIEEDLAANFRDLVEKLSPGSLIILDGIANHSNTDADKKKAIKNFLAKISA
jgi:HEAT repeat protein